jgi:hypothetical protein
VSIRKSLSMLFVCAVLQFGALAGAHMTPEDIEKLMEVMNRTKVVHVLKTEDNED